jgi:hypothetical protein
MPYPPAHETFRLFEAQVDLLEAELAQLMFKSLRPN